MTETSAATVTAAAAAAAAPPAGACNATSNSGGDSSDDAVMMMTTVASPLGSNNNSTNNNNTGNTGSHKTPPRNNYSNQHTPIASIKRPRSSMEAVNGKNRTAGNAAAAPAAAAPQPRTNNGGGCHIDPMTLSPLHPPRAVPRSCHTTAAAHAAAIPSLDDDLEEQEQDDLFSPVLKMDNGSGHGGAAGSNKSGGNSDNDTEPTAASSSSTSNSGSTGVVVIAKTSSSLDGDEDDDEEDVLDDDDFCSSANNNKDHSHGGCDHDNQSECSLSVTEPDHVDDDDFNPWQFIKSLPPYAHVSHLTPQVALPPRWGADDNNSPGAASSGGASGAGNANNSNINNKSETPLTLVLDLDETLVHCTVESCEGCDFSFGVTFHGVEYQVYVRLRPHLFEFLDLIKDKYEVVVFTASQKVYADELLDRIDPERKHFHHRLFRESCLAVEGNFLKDLSVLGRDLSKTVLVDNSPHAFGYQLDNGIPIESWFDDPDDRELLKLARFLRQIADSPDVREDCRRKFLCAQRVAQAPDYSTSAMATM